MLAAALFGRRLSRGALPWTAPASLFRRADTRATADSPHRAFAGSCFSGFDLVRRRRAMLLTIFAPPDRKPMLAVIRLVC
jgi:hypothetical protein